jgi:hypothetical protein
MALVVRKLVEFRHQSWLDGYQSVKYTHLCDSVTTHFPLWLIALWATVLDLQKMVRKPWVQAREWLGTELWQQRSRERRALAEDAKAFFRDLPWDNNTVHNMWRFIGPHWTTSLMQNDLLDELSNRITAWPHLAARLQVRNLSLTAKIMEAAATHTSDTYQTAQSFRWIRALGEDIILHQQTILTLHHLGENNKH